MAVGRVLGIPFLRPASGFDGDFAALGNCELWLDGQDASTQWQDAAGTTPAGMGDTIQKWDDKSGNGNDASRVQAIASVSDSGLNGNRGVYGGGGLHTGSFSQGNLTGPYTIFAVIENATPSTDARAVYDGNTAANRNLLLWSVPNGRLRHYGVGYNPSSGTVSGTGVHTMTTVVKATGAGLYDDNALVGTTWNETQLTMVGMTVGAIYTNTNTWLGYIGDIIVYSNDFSAADRENISNLLAAKYGI